MLNRVIAFSLHNRALVLAAAGLLLAFGGYQAAQLPIDVFPDLNRPTVAVMTEAPGLAPEEIETLVTFPIESALNGATGVQRVRSASGIGLSVVWVEFGWGSDIHVDRQIVAERLQLARERLPQGAVPVMAPVSSIMGEIMLVGLRATGPTTPMELRTLADWVVRPRLLAQRGVSQVTVMGGRMRQFQVLTSPERLARYDVTLDELVRAVEKSNVVRGGGFLLQGAEESLIRIVGQAVTLADLESTVVRADGPAPITIRQVADCRHASPVPRGDGSVGGLPAVILSVQKQPGADTLDLDARVGQVLAELDEQLPDDVLIEPGLFRQSRFIETAIGNVQEAIRDGALWVVLVLFVFLWNVRTSFITLTAIPLSVILTALVFRAFGVTVNTMTLGGLAVAIGELVDDSIVDIENIYRRLKENRRKPQPLPPLKVIFLASAEVRNSIVYATAIVVLVVLPLFALEGLEGRMFAPLGLSYLLTLVASLLVSLTVTPALSSYLLPRARFIAAGQDPLLLRWLKKLDTLLLRFTLRHAWGVLSAVAVLVAVSLASIIWMGGEFLPPFNEGTLTVGVTLPPATSLAESNRIGAQVERMLLEVPEVSQVSRRSGRAELDEHAENVNYSEIDVSLVEPARFKPGWHNALFRAVPGLHGLGVEHVGRPRQLVLEQVREILAELPGAAVNVGQPISHRIDHIMSGVQAQIAVKLFGPDLDQLRRHGRAVFDQLAQIPGIVDLQLEPQVEIPQIRATVLRQEAARFALAPDDVATAMETALKGRIVSQVIEDQRTFDLVVWFDESARDNLDAIRATPLSTPGGARVALASVADIRRATGPNTIHRENVARRIVVQANVAGRDLAGVVEDVQLAVQQHVVPHLPRGYHVEYGGQFEAQQQANRRLAVIAAAAVLGIFLLLQRALGAWQAALQVMVNIPLAAVGSILTLALVNHPTAESLAAASWWQWPRVWIEATTLSVAHWIGFITLVGIVSRNGIMMISHYIHLMRHEGEQFNEAMIIRGSLERLAPVLMTALTTTIGLVPLALGAGQTGKEILHPLAIVVIGGLISSTLLDQVVTPALFFKFGRRTWHRSLDRVQPDAPDRLAARFDDPRPPSAAP